MDKLKLKQIIQEELDKVLNEKFGINNMEDNDDNVSISSEMNLGIISIPKG